MSQTSSSRGKVKIETVTTSTFLRLLGGKGYHSKQSRILSFLWLNSGAVCSCQQIAEYVYGDDLGGGPLSAAACLYIGVLILRKLGCVIETHQTRGFTLNKRYAELMNAIAAAQYRYVGMLDHVLKINQIPLSHDQAMLLNEFSKHGSIKSAGATERARNSNVSYNTRKLSDLGYIYLMPNRNDNRAKIVVLTDHGHYVNNLVKDALAAQAKDFEEEFGDVSQVVSTMRKLGLLR